MNLRWEELCKHDRFGIAVLGVCGTIKKCTPSFASMVSTDTVGAEGTTFHDYLDAGDIPRIIKRLKSLATGDASMASLDLLFLDSGFGKKMHAVEMIPFGDDTVWVIAFKIESGDIRLLQENLEKMKDKLIHFAQVALEKNVEVNINTTNITGEKNQSVQAKDVDDASQGN